MSVFVEGSLPGQFAVLGLDKPFEVDSSLRLMAWVIQCDEGKDILRQMIEAGLDEIERLMEAEKGLEQEVARLMTKQRIANLAAMLGHLPERVTAMSYAVGYDGPQVDDPEIEVVTESLQERVRVLSQ